MEVADSSTPFEQDIVYPYEDGEPLAESYDHLNAIWVTLEILKQYLEGQQATILADQFLYYAQGFPRLRVTPDVMVTFGVETGGRDSFKIWEERAVPSVIFEMTSKSTQKIDQIHKYCLYSQLGVQEYWLFDPKGEWLESPLTGYRLEGDDYVPIKDCCSRVLGLRLAVDGKLIGFTALETGTRLLSPAELREALEKEKLRATEARMKADRLRAQLRELGVDPVE